MKICPVCNESFEDQLNFCDVDGTRLAREDSAQQRNRLWSFLGAGLLVGALVISAASIFFLPRARVAAPVVNSEPSPAQPQPKAPSAESTASVAASTPAAEPETGSPEAVVPVELRKKDRPFVEGGASTTAPNPKAAALAAEDPDKKAASGEIHAAAPPAPKKAETSPEVTGVTEAHPPDAGSRPQPAPELKKDSKSQPTAAKSSEKDLSDKKKKEEDKKKGGFLRVFKKIFGKE